MTTRHIFAIILALGATAAAAQEPPVNYSATVNAYGSTGDFSPYFISALDHGKHVRASGTDISLRAERPLNLSRRFSWSAGAEVMAGAATANDYRRWYEESQAWGSRSNRPSAVWLQQLYGRVKYRAVFLRAGLKDYSSRLLDESVASGDLTRGANARGVPGVEVGFLDFQDIPFTRGWVQIDGVVEYGKYTDDGFKKKQYSYYNYLTTTGVYYTYKRCYFRTMPSQPLSVTVGMQTAGQFGGTTYYYGRGKLTATDRRGFRVADVFKMFLPVEGNGNSFYEGNSLGSWDLKARYRFASGHELSFVWQGPWEDGSGIGRLNGADGLWGLYFKSAAERPLFAAAAIEYLDFRNQSGPIHFAPHDHPGSTITSNASGGDNYYNNDTYGSYSNYGVAQATPFLVAPIYNLDGNPYFAHNRARGIHAAARGWLSPEVSYTVKYSWQQAWGMGRVSTTHCLIDNSAMVAVGWDASRWAEGLRFDVKVAFDAGSLRGNNFGTLASVTYSGNISLSKSTK